jgi:hypothetical protein
MEKREMNYIEIQHHKIAAPVKQKKRKKEKELYSISITIHIPLYLTMSPTHRYIV